MVTAIVYGSVAEVERLWSIAKHILTDERKGRMDTHMFQNLLFLKMNRRLFNISDLMVADKRREGQEKKDCNEENDFSDDDSVVTVLSG